jgi:flagellar basal-body rod modification protein FlgD
MNGLGITNATTQQAGPQGGATQTAAGGALGKEEFLHLLVTQLKNQDPMSPMNGQEFAAQLAQFTSVEQLVNISEVLAQNGDMNGMLAQSINGGVAAGLIGKTVEASGNTIGWNGSDPSEMKFELAAGAAEVSVSIRNAAGVEVRVLDLGGRSGGAHSFEWDGTTGTGAAAASGTYTFDVTATDSQGKPVAAQSATTGVVDRITFGQDGIRLWLGEHSVAMSDVSSVQ